MNLQRYKPFVCSGILVSSARCRAVASQTTTADSQHDETADQLVTNSRSWNEDTQTMNSEQPRLTGVWRTTPHSCFFVS